MQSVRRQLLQQRTANLPRFALRGGKQRHVAVGERRMVSARGSGEASGQISIGSTERNQAAATADIGAGEYRLRAEVPDGVFSLAVEADEATAR